MINSGPCQAKRAQLKEHMEILSVIPPMREERGRGIVHLFDEMDFVMGPL